jgi:hypothetical protein
MSTRCDLAACRVGKIAIEARPSRSAARAILPTGREI